MKIINNDWQLQCIGIRSRVTHILKEREFSDCTFVLGKEPNQVRIGGHKIILAISSPVFQAMFFGSISSTESEIAIVDIETDIFKSLLVYIYTDVIEIDSFEKACELYYAAKKYMLPHLTEECVTYLSSKLCAGNALKLFEFAKFNDYEYLMDQCVEVIQKCTKEVLNDTSFTEASLETVCMVFSMDPLNIDSELELSAAAKQYAKVNKECAVPAENIEPSTSDGQDVIANEKCATPTELMEGRSRPEATFRFTVQNFSSLDAEVWSPPHYIRNLPWQISLKSKMKQITPNKSRKSLGIQLWCNRESKSTCWSCYATFQLGLVNHEPATQIPFEDDDELFHSKETCVNYSTPWDELLDTKNGYIKDDSITVEVHIIAEAPHGVLGTPKHTGSVVRNDKLTIRHAVRLIRFLTMTAEQFAKEVTDSSLLTKYDERAILLNIISDEANESMPKGFCESRIPRTK